MKGILVFLVLYTAPGWTSTFTGNGGNAGDVELIVTKAQIKQVFELIASKEQVRDTLCGCNPRYEVRSVCEPLKALNDDKRKFCGNALYSQATKILTLIGSEDATQIRWTNEKIEVSENGANLAVDAVTDPATKTITINRERFMDMRQFERVFLLTHELLHLTELDGKRLVDEGTIGPFDGGQGGRQLLNAMGSAAAVLDGRFPKEINTYRAKLRRSQAWKPFWVEFNVGANQFNGAKEKNLTFKGYKREQFAFRYIRDEWSYIASVREEKQDKTIYNSLKIKESKAIYSLGAGYRFFFAKDPSTFWGQSHLLVQGTLDYIKAEYNMNDGFTEFNEKVNAWGVTLAAQYYLPLFWNVWAYVGVGYEHHPYEYKNVAVKYDKGLTSQYAGVSYAF